jgi:formamidopyrimidine-DNA glycosylase
MPELPELEALVRALDGPLRGAPVAGRPTAHFAVLKTFEPPLAGLDGKRFTGARRRGKYLLFDVEDGTTLSMHLMSAGRVGYHASGARQPKGTGAALRIAFADGASLVATEGGTKKRMRVGLYTPEGLATLLDGLGPEPLDAAFDRAALDAVLDAAPHRLHPLLRDQRAVAGIGRAFANEILHAARLSPFAVSDRLDDDGRERLLQAVRDTLGHALAVCEQRMGPQLPARNDARPLVIHKHEGEPCPRCSETLRFVDYEEHRIVYCPRCQTGGRLLADRRMSRLLK